MSGMTTGCHSDNAVCPLRGQYNREDISFTPCHAPLWGTRHGADYFAPFGDVLAYGHHDAYMPFTR